MPALSPGAAWAVLIVSACFETAWAIGLPRTEGFTRLGPSLFVLSTMAVSILGLSTAARVLPIGTAYAVWVGIGAAGTVAVGIAAYGEPATVGRLLCVGLIVAGVVGLKLVGDG